MLSLLASCGGGGSPAATTTPTVTTEVINGITVPIAPDTAANEATLKGVDSNNNGVRDDVERSIATNSPNSLTGAIKYAKTIQAQIDGNILTNQELTDAFCESLKVDMNAGVIEQLTLNNEDRDTAFYKNRIDLNIPDCM
jgi:hypothetical protein